MNVTSLRQLPFFGLSSLDTLYHKSYTKETEKNNSSHLSYDQDGDIAYNNFKNIFLNWKMLKA